MREHETSPSSVSGDPDSERAGSGPVVMSAPEAPAGGPRCGGRVEVYSPEGEVRCELGKGHAAKWHRNEAAGYEWSGGVLWLLPRGTTRAA